MFVVVVLSAAVSYGLLYIAPGGPIEQLRQQEQQNEGENRVTPADIARIRARFELDLYLPVRFSRWLIGLPRGPLQVGGQTYLADAVVGCAEEQPVRLRYPDGRVELIRECVRPLTLAEIEGRRSSRGILLGDLGLSQTILRDRPITDLVASRLPYTLTLMGVSIALSILIGVPLGVYSAVRPYSRFDTIATALAFVGSSLPSFVFAIFAILLLAVLPDRAGLPHLPTGNAEATRDYMLLGLRVEAGSFFDRVVHFILPCAVLTLTSLAGWSRFIRTSMLEVLSQDYVRTARAKGVRERVVILKHALRNALIPFITLLAGVLPALFGGAVITETIFNWPGLGRLLVDALARSDYTVAMALTFIQIVLLLIGYLIADILYTVADPRIKLA
jgi:peptide/nickel transport system permease protein